MCFSKLTLDDTLDKRYGVDKGKDLETLLRQGEVDEQRQK